MIDTIYGREAYIDRIKNYAESPIVGNQAFLGVKGVGKTTLFQSYFSKEKRGELAQEYKNLFVFSQLDSRKQGTDLYKFLLDQVKIGIRGIPDKESKQEIKTEMDEIDEVFETPESRLTQYLDVIKEAGYNLIIIMDQFHCMARDTEIGKEQYDVLRSFNEQKLITYWIITDTDLMETCASKQYIASFFAQKFTSKMTICPVDDEGQMGVLEYFDSLKKSELSSEEKKIVAEVSGGIPELISILLDLAIFAKNEGKVIDRDGLIEIAVMNNACISLFDGWVSGLSNTQRKIMFDVATSEGGLNAHQIDTTESKMAELADDVGRGLLHVQKDADEKIWKINIPFFRAHILHKGKEFINKESSALVEERGEQPESYVTNIYNIEGNFIQSQTNNVLSIENAVAGLEDLQRLVHGSPLLLDGNKAIVKLDYLPFRQEVWSEMDENEQEDELEKYADGVFSSDLFSKGALTQEQMNKFFLTEGLLDSLSDSCRTQIMCGVQVYELIQLCVDNFGLSMAESESSRGILFARAFERHLKDFIAPAYCRIPELAERHVYPTIKPFKEFPLDKTTIGTYSTILSYGFRIFAQASNQLLNRTELDEQWWKKLSNRLSEIGALRNDCCHSGMTFGSDKLNNLISKIFEQEAIADVLVFGEIPTLRRNQFPVKASNTTTNKPKATKTNNALSYKNPDISLLGKKIRFEVLSKTTRGNYKGTVNGIYEGSLPKSFAIKLDFNSVRNKQMDAVVDKIQDGKFVLKL